MLYCKFKVYDNDGRFDDYGDQFIGLYDSINKIFLEVLNFKSVVSDVSVIDFFIQKIKLNKPQYLMSENSRYNDEFIEDTDNNEPKQYFYKSNFAIFDDSDKFVFGNYIDEERDVQYELVDVLKKIKSAFLIYNKKNTELFDSLAIKYEISNDLRYDITYYKTIVNIKYVRKYNLVMAEKILNCCKEFLANENVL
jgi:hypothetical protein